jgi:hypothetical protein
VDANHLIDNSDSHAAGKLYCLSSQLVADFAHRLAQRCSLIMKSDAPGLGLYFPTHPHKSEPAEFASVVQSSFFSPPHSSFWQLVSSRVLHGFEGHRSVSQSFRMSAILDLVSQDGPVDEMTRLFLSEKQSDNRSEVRVRGEHQWIHSFLLSIGSDWNLMVRKQIHIHTGRCGGGNPRLSPDSLPLH